MRRAAVSLLLSLTVSAFAATSGDAQITEANTFTIGGASFQSPDVAVGTDGSIVFIWSEFSSGERHAFTRHYSATAAPLGGRVTVDTTTGVRETAISTRPDGSMIAAWHLRDGGSAIYGRSLDAAGVPTGPGFKVTVADDFADLMSVVGLSTGSVFAWRQSSMRTRVYDEADAPRAPEVVLADSGNRSDAVALPDGGYLIVWNGVPTPGGSNVGRFYDADGTPRGPAFPLGAEIRPRRVAINPQGDIAVVGTGTAASGNTGGVWMRRLTPAGELSGSPVLVHPTYADGESWVADVELDAQGNALVVWAGTDGGNILTQQVRGRAYGPGNAPIAHPFVIADEHASGIRVARLADDHFVAVWNPAGEVSAKVLSLCLPPVAQCGDGVVHPDCEQCDGGAANSDTAPDACRSDCSLPRCGDGTIDSAEQCDDGNLTSCDGCSVTCISEPGLACGDGIPEPTCGQPCDDANGTVGDGCTLQCGLEPIPGGGSRSIDCRTVWIVENPGNDPLLDSHGAFRSKQRCVDGDPACDFDGGTPGGCVFHVRVCANASGLPDCESGRIASWGLDRPSVKQAATKPVLAAARTSFAPVPGVVVGPSSNDVCSDWLPVAVPLKGEPGKYQPGKLTLKSRAVPYEGADDKDTLKLECTPEPS